MKRNKNYHEQLRQKVRQQRLEQAKMYREYMAEPESVKRAVRERARQILESWDTGPDLYEFEQIAQEVNSELIAYQELLDGKIEAKGYYIDENGVLRLAGV